MVTKQYARQRWRIMMHRCYSPNDISYAYYGARGITVCARWHDFENFYEDLKDIIAKGLEMDRIDNDRGYEPGNVQFITTRANSSKRRSNLNRTLPLGVMFKRKQPLHPYQARINIGKKKIDLGSYATPEEAGEAYKRALAEYLTKTI